MEDANILLEALQEYEHIYTLGKEAWYYSLLMTKDSQDTYIKAKYNQANDFETKMANKLLFFELNISKIPEEKQHALLSNPIVEKYKHFLEIIFANAKYTLSEKEEQIVNIMTKTSKENWENMLEDFLSEEKATIIYND